jgi:hypothetical protein
MSILSRAIKYMVTIKPLDPFAWWDPMGMKKDGHLVIRAAFYEDPIGKYFGRKVTKKTFRSYGLDTDKITSRVDREYTDRKYSWTEVFLFSYDRSTDVKFPLRQELHGQEWILQSPDDSDRSKTSLRNSKGDFELEPNQFYMLATGEKLDLERLKL